MISTFIGIDLAWQSDKNHSGIMVMEGDKNGAEIISYSKGITNLEGVINYIKPYKTSNTIIAIDAPLIIKNKTGQRPCEKLISKKFGSRHASAHSPNLDRYPDAGSVKLANILGKEGFIHNPPEDIFKKSCWFFKYILTLQC
jgi:predicted RNase H-like nuclease